MGDLSVSKGMKGFMHYSRILFSMRMNFIAGLQ